MARRARLDILTGLKAGATNERSSLYGRYIDEGAFISYQSPSWGLTETITFLYRDFLRPAYDLGRRE